MRRKMYEATPHSLPLVGLCQEMCPEYERYEREIHLDVSPFEVMPGTERSAGFGDHPKIDHSRAVKKYHRPAAGNEAPLPEDVRPAPVLVKTMNYLVGLLDRAWNDSVLTGDLSGFAQAQGFVRDRTRSIRQDATLQNLRTDPDSIAVHQSIARFHILSGHRLSSLPKTEFDAFQNTEQMRKVLQSLSEFYTDSRPVEQEGEAEFRAYYLVTHLEDPDVFRKCFGWPKKVLQSAPVQWALAAGAAFHQGDFVHFFRLLTHRPTGMSPTTLYLASCLLHSHFIPMRTRAASIICKSYAPNSVFPVAKFASWLAFEDQTELVDFCEATGFVITFGPSGEPVSVLKPTNIMEPVGTIRPRCNRRFIESILPPGTTITQIINGSTEEAPIVPIVQMVVPQVAQVPHVLPQALQVPQVIPKPIQVPQVQPVPQVPQAPVLPNPILSAHIQPVPVQPTPIVTRALLAPIPPPPKKDVGPMAKAVLDSLVSAICLEQVQLISTSVHILHTSKHTQLSMASSALLEAFLDDLILDVSQAALSKTAQNRSIVLESLEKNVLAALVSAEVSEAVTELAQESFQAAFKASLAKNASPSTTAEDERLFRAYEDGIRVERPATKRRNISFAPPLPVSRRPPVKIEPLLKSLEQEQRESARFEAYLSGLLNQK